MVRYRAASAFAPHPFDKIGAVGAVALVDDFVTTYTEADFTTGKALQSDLHWWGAEVGSNDEKAHAAVLVAESDHVGIVRLTTGTATSPADGDGVSLQLGGTGTALQDTLLLDTNGVYIAAVLRVPDVDGQSVEFGLIGQAPEEANKGALDVIAWAFDPADTTNVDDEEWFCQVNGANSDTEVISKLVSYVENDWVLLEIAADSTSATFRITTEDNTETIVIDGADSVTMPLVALRPVISTCNIGSADEILDIDTFVFRYIRRQPLYASWLGQ